MPGWVWLAVASVTLLVGLSVASPAPGQLGPAERSVSRRAHGGVTWHEEATHRALAAPKDHHEPRHGHRPNWLASGSEWGALPVGVLDADPWLRAAMRLTLCGLRRSEVLGLDWESVDLSDGLVTVSQGRVKTGRSRDTAHGEAKSDDSHRVVPVEVIHPGTKAALRELWAKQGQPSSGLVVVDALHEPVDPDTYSRRFRALSAEAELPDLGSIHNVRHTVATALHDNGVEPRKAASLLGHKVTTHLAFYVPTTDAGASEAAAVAGGCSPRPGDRPKDARED